MLAVPRFLPKQEDKMKRRVSRGAVGTLAALAWCAHAENLVESSLEARFQLDLHVPDAALAAYLPTGFSINIAPQGAAKDAEQPSCLSVMRCLKHAILPKTYVPRFHQRKS
jgi:hypothetical protein